MTEIVNSSKTFQNTDSKQVEMNTLTNLAVQNVSLPMLAERSNLPLPLIEGIINKLALENIRWRGVFLSDIRYELRLECLQGEVLISALNIPLSEEYEDAKEILEDIDTMLHHGFTAIGIPYENEVAILSRGDSILIRGDTQYELPVFAFRQVISSVLGTL